MMHIRAEREFHERLKRWRHEHQHDTFNDAILELLSRGLKYEPPRPVAVPSVSQEQAEAAAEERRRIAEERAREAQAQRELIERQRKEFAARKEDERISQMYTDLLSAHRDWIAEKFAPYLRARFGLHGVREGWPVLVRERGLVDAKGPEVKASMDALMAEQPAVGEAKS